MKRRDFRYLLIRQFLVAGSMRFLMNSHAFLIRMRRCEQAG